MKSSLNRMAIVCKTFQYCVSTVHVEKHCNVSSWIVALLKSFHITSDVMMIRSAAGEPGFFFFDFPSQTGTVTKSDR